ncbi:MAG: response regulator [Spirochaeta sp.]|nr:response regulator [Spirochaeta sp.]
MKILIVEDEVLISMHLARQLEQAGYVVCGPVTSGVAAITAAEQQKPDVVLMDIRLPGEMDGIEAGGTITERHGIPVIFLTGYSDSTIESRAQAVTAAKVLGKPASISEIATEIDRLLA